MLQMIWLSMTSKVKIATLVVVAMGALTAFVLFTTGNASNADQATYSSNVADCARQLHAAQAREETWNFLPFGYDLDGRPAIHIHMRPETYEYDEVKQIAQATECYVSKGQWWNRPLNIISDDHITIGRYDGKSFIPASWSR
jgi:hypothetical protein